MGSVVVDQIAPDGTLVEDYDTTLRNSEKERLLLTSLPDSRVADFGGERVVRFENQVILKKQVTHLGNPWPGFKKRIQIPRRWLEVERQASAQDLRTRFVGIYHYDGVTIFVDFDPNTYVQRKANNSAAHVMTNDLFQAQTDGLFTRLDRNGNRLTSVRFDQFADYLRGDYEAEHPRLDVFRRFNAEFLQEGRIEALPTIRQMHVAAWPDTFQGEWPGFYLEFRLDEFIRRHHLEGLVQYQKDKSRGGYDYDLVFKRENQPLYYGDLKASSASMIDSPGNDAATIERCVAEFGRFWYVIYEHDTWHSRDNRNLATIAWNEWRRSVGHVSRKEFNPLSYAARFKESVHFFKMSILEVNEANLRVALGDFHQGRQPGGATRALKVKIDKRTIENFLVYSEDGFAAKQDIRLTPRPRRSRSELR